MKFQIDHPEVGQIILHADKYYEIVSYTIQVDKDGIQPIARIQPIDDDGEDLDEDPITVNLDMWDYADV